MVIGPPRFSSRVLNLDLPMLPVVIRVDILPVVAVARSVLQVVGCTTGIRDLRVS